MVARHRHGRDRRWWDACVDLVPHDRSRSVVRVHLLDSSRARDNSSTESFRQQSGGEPVVPVAMGDEDVGEVPVFRGDPVTECIRLIGRESGISENRIPTSGHEGARDWRELLSLAVRQLTGGWWRIVDEHVVSDVRVFFTGTHDCPPAATGTEGCHHPSCAARVPDPVSRARWPSTSPRTTACDRNTLTVSRRAAGAQPPDPSSVHSLHHRSFRQDPARRSGRLRHRRPHPAEYAGRCRASQSVRVRRAVAEICARGYRVSNPWKPPAQTWSSAWPPAAQMRVA